MMYRPATVPVPQRINAPRPRMLPRPQVVKALVNQPVNLRPAGNTISLTVPAEMPFMMSGPMTVVTQASGGMAKPDSRMRSKRLLSNEMAGVRGLSGELEDAAYAWFNQYDADAKNMDRSAYDADAGKRAYWEAQVSQSKAPAASSTPTDWASVGKVTAGVLNTLTPVATQLIAAKNQSQTNPGGFLPGMTQAVQTYIAPPKKSNTALYIGIGVAALAVGAFFLFRRKGAVSQAAA